MTVPGANLLISFLSHVAGPLIAVPTPSLPPSPEVVVRNSGTVEAPLTVKLTVPAHALTRLEASDAVVVVVVAGTTDRDELFLNRTDDAGARRMAWIGSIFFGILTVIGAVWLYRKVKPEPLTPASADKPPLPGGAPSE